MRHTGWRRGSHLNLIDASTRVPERWFVSPCAATTKSADRSDCLCGALRGLLDDRKIDPLCRNGLQRVLRMGNGFAHKRQNFSNLVPLWRTVRHCGGSLDAVRRITTFGGRQPEGIWTAISPVELAGCLAGQPERSWFPKGGL